MLRDITDSFVNKCVPVEMCRSPSKLSVFGYAIIYFIKLFVLKKGEEIVLKQ